MQPWTFLSVSPIDFLRVELLVCRGLYILSFIGNAIVFYEVVILKCTPKSNRVFIFLFFLRFYLFISRWGEGREKEKFPCVVTSRAPPTWGPGPQPRHVLSDWESNWWPFGSQACTQSTEPHQSGHFCLFCIVNVLSHSVAFLYWYLLMDRFDIIIVVEF